MRYSIIGRLQNLVTSLLGGAERAATYETVAFCLSYRLLQRLAALEKFIGWQPPLVATNHKKSMEIY